MIGDIIVAGGIEYEVVWSGGEGLIGDREIRAGELWGVPTKRAYHKKKTEFWAKYLEPKPSSKPTRVEETDMSITDSAAFNAPDRANGETEPESGDLSVADQIEVLFEAITQLGEQIREQHEEILEKLNNLSLPGPDYEVLQEES